MQSIPVQIVFTDLDGTLLNTERTVSTRNLACLHQLGRRGITRVIATGRSQYSFRKVITPSFPADYLIFSSGAGILDLQNDSLLHSTNLSAGDIAIITEQLQAHRADFMVHHPVPDNHKFVYCGYNDGNKDFNRRIQLYREFAKSYGNTVTFPSSAAQIIAVLPNDTTRFAAMKSSLNGYQVTRTTSPLDHRSIWMEIYSQDIHKGSAAAWLCGYLGVDPAGAVGIGNDYNDLELLDFTPHSYMLRNAPAELHPLYRLGRSNDEDGFSHAVEDATGSA